jgi:RecB family exonuclease
MKIDNVITFPLNEPLIPGIADIIERDYISTGKPLDRLAFVFGGRRPSLFLKRELASRIKKPFIPPVFFSMDDFASYVAYHEQPPKKVSSLDAAYIIYGLAQKHAPEMLKNRESFALFLPWAREIEAFIGQLDREAVESKALLNIQKNAEIGYDVPKSINALLRQINEVRDEYHKKLAGMGMTTQGMIYSEAAKNAAVIELAEFDRVYFCNSFYLQKTEQRIIQALMKNGKAHLVFQGSADEWEILREMETALGISIRHEKAAADNCKISFYSGFDTHSQVELVREIAGKLEKPERSVLIVPDPASIIPALAEIAPAVGEFNVSLGYPLNRSSLYTLLKYVIDAQETRKGGEYYAKDYLSALRHPLAKNTSFNGKGADFTRTVVHKIEERITGDSGSEIGGSIFIDPEKLFNEQEFVQGVKRTLLAAGIETTEDEIVNTARSLNDLLFKSWQELDELKRFAQVLRKFTETMAVSSPLTGYPLNAKAAVHLLDVCDELVSSAVSAVTIGSKDVFRIAEEHIGSVLIPFQGSPLKGFQMLGVYESRSLDFDDVIIMDMNEGLLPSIKLKNALVPREIMAGLGLGLIEKDEEITRYYFKRLVSGAKRAHLIWAENDKNPRSRYIEELVWSEQKKSGALSAADITTQSFKMDTVPGKTHTGKTPETMELLAGITFSPSAIDTYLNCPKRFYFSKILNLKEKEEIGEELEASQIGTYIHELLKNSFEKFLGKKPVIDAKFSEEFDKLNKISFERDIAPKMTSGAFMLKEVADYFMGKLLANEKTRAESEIEKILKIEELMSGAITIEGATYKFRGIVDRIDRLTNGQTLILDYKTGRSDKLPKALKGLQEMMEDPTRENILNGVRSFQLPIYMEIAKQKYGYSDINAGIYDVRAAEIKLFNDQKDDDNTKTQRYSLCLKALGVILKEIMDPKVSFIANDSEPGYCDNCPYFYACR